MPLDFAVVIHRGAAANPPTSVQVASIAKFIFAILWDRLLIVISAMPVFYLAAKH